MVIIKTDPSDPVNKERQDYTMAMNPYDDDIKEKLQDYYGTAMMSGFPAAMANLVELDDMSEEELEELAEELGITE